jgi:hypothetical protein
MISNAKIHLKNYACGVKLYVFMAVSPIRQGSPYNFTPTFNYILYLIIKNKHYLCSR